MGRASPGIPPLLKDFTPNFLTIRAYPTMHPQPLMDLQNGDEAKVLYIPRSRHARRKADFGTRRQMAAFHSEAFEPAQPHIQPVEACNPPAA
jgi:hypothetical protein